MIAPFWADLELTSSGDAVYYQQYARNPNGKPNESPEDALIFTIAADIIRNSTGDTNFAPTMIVKITWQNVAPYPAKKADPIEVS
jgi:hypothetical protein